MKTLVSLGTLIVLAIVGFVLWMWGPQLGHGLWSFLRYTWPYLLIAIGGVIAAFAAFVYFEDLDEFFGGIALGAVAVVVVLGMIGFNMVGSWERAKNYADSIEVVAVSGDQSEIPSYEDRVPFDVASAVSQRTLGNTNGDATGVIKAIPSRGQFTSSVVRRGAFQGYESTQVMSLPTYGSAKNTDVTFCKFSDDAKLRFGGGVPSNNLTRAIYAKTSPSVRVERDDAFIVCEDGTPMVYAPLTELKGVLFPARFPAGVAIYNGESGELVIEESYEGDLPVYPSSVAKAQREATAAAGSFWDYTFKRVGFEDTSKDAEDPNGSNRSEFSLADTDGDSHFVTPLTPRGDSKSITALGDVHSSTTVAGELNPYSVYVYPDDQPRQANSSIAARITSEVLDGYKATGLSVFEVVPAADGTWAASIGKSQSILYRAIIHPDGTIELFNANGDLVKEGSLDEEVVEPTEPVTPSDPIAIDGDLADLTDAQLQDLGRAILEELGARSGS